MTQGTNTQNLIRGNENVDWNIATSLARYAVERLHVEEPVVVALTDGFFEVIAVAQKVK